MAIWNLKFCLWRIEVAIEQPLNYLFILLNVIILYTCTCFHIFWSLALKVYKLSIVTMQNKTSRVNSILRDTAIKQNDCSRMQMFMWRETSGHYHAMSELATAWDAPTVCHSCDVACPPPLGMYVATERGGRPQRMSQFSDIPQDCDIERSYIVPTLFTIREM
jgi:hypothetical protein